MALTAVAFVAAILCAATGRAGADDGLAPGTPRKAEGGSQSSAPLGERPVLPGLPATARGGSESAGPPTLRTDDLAVLEQVNRVRAQHGLGAIQFNVRLFHAARAHSDEQLRQNFLGHGSLDPDRVRLTDRMLAAGYVGRVYAEVVARDYMTVESVVRAWMDSPTHREVLLDPELSEGAFCRLDSADGRTNRWTGDFGAPDALAPPVPPQLPAVPKPAAAPPMTVLRSTEPVESRSVGNPPTSAPRSAGAAPSAPAPASITPSAARVSQPGVPGVASRPAITSPPPPPPPPALGPTRTFAPTPVPPAAPPMVRSMPQPTYAVTPPPPPPPHVALNTPRPAAGATLPLHCSSAQLRDNLGTPRMRVVFDAIQEEWWWYGDSVVTVRNDRAIGWSDAGELSGRLQRIAEYGGPKEGLPQEEVLPWAVAVQPVGYTPTSTPTTRAWAAGSAVQGGALRLPALAPDGSYYGELSPATGRPKTVFVRPYVRRDGTFVQAHYRSRPRR